MINAVTDDFRQQCRHWLEQNCPASQRMPIVKEQQIWAGRQQQFHNDEAKLWFERMRDKGWTAPQWPSQYGGGGLDDQQAKILSEEMRKLNCRPPLYDMGLWMLGPALLEHGNEDQKAEHIPKIIRGEIRWCQGYSEPAAGSDLVSLTTKAEDMGDHLLVNGSKIWTTSANLSDFIFCLVRTDTSAPKQQGISFLLIDMSSLGVSTAPIPLISGESEFCQTFFDNVKVPKSNIVGDLNNGWTVAKSLLKHERKLMSSMGDMVPQNTLDILAAAKQYIGIQEQGSQQGQLKDSALRGQITKHLMAVQAQQYCNQRLYLEMRQGIKSHLPLLMKLIATAEVQKKDELLLAILGTQGLGWEGENFSEKELLSVRNWAFNKSLTIAGGTSEVQMNIIAKRALNLPD